MVAATSGWPGVEDEAVQLVGGQQEHSVGADDPPCDAVDLQTHDTFHFHIVDR